MAYRVIFGEKCRNVLTKFNKFNFHCHTRNFSMKTHHSDLGNSCMPTNKCLQNGLQNSTSKKIITFLPINCGINKSTLPLSVTVLPWMMTSSRSLCTSHKLFNKLIQRKPSDLQQTAFEVDGNVVQDVLLFKYENDRLYQVLTLFGIVQFLFWMYLAHFSYTTLRDVKPNKGKDTQENVDLESLPWWKKINFGSNIYKSGITVMCLTLGYLCLAVSIIYPMRTVNQLHLLKGGKKVKFITYSLWNRRREFTAPLDHLTCLHSRIGPEKQIAMKVKNHYMFYLLDKTGTFTNTQLYDFIVGVKRTW